MHRDLDPPHRPSLRCHRGRRWDHQQGMRTFVRMPPPSQKSDSAVPKFPGSDGRCRRPLVRTDEGVDEAGCMSQTRSDPFGRREKTARPNVGWTRGDLGATTRPDGNRCRVRLHTPDEVVQAIRAVRRPSEVHARRRTDRSVIPGLSVHQTRYVPRCQPTSGTPSPRQGRSSTQNARPEPIGFNKCATRAGSLVPVSGCPLPQIKGSQEGSQRDQSS
jgi:hypothetical protein